MKKRIVSVVSLVVLGGVVLFARPASAKVDVSIFSLHDRSLIADFEDASDDGCFVTQTHILFSEAVIFQSGTPPTIQSPSTQVTIDYANSCTGEFFELTGGTSTQTFQIASDLSKATLKAIVPVTDGASNNASVSLNVTWTANAPVQQVKSTNISHDANTITVDHVNVSARTADVVGPVSATLTVLNDMGQEVATLFDLSRFPEGGQLGKDNEGTRTVTFIHGCH
jgi:hypothetical protein